MASPDDQYSRVDYRRLIAWESRIERESSFLRRLLEEAPARAVADLGCGTGEHVAFFSGDGCRAVGVDRSESMIEKARELEARGDGRFVLGDARDAPALLSDEAPFGLALCLGNMLPHVKEDADLVALLESAHAVLAPRGLFLVQLVNYSRILEQGVRHLPLNFRAGDSSDDEIVFLRLMKPGDDGRILFFPTTLTLHADDEDEPVRVEQTRRVELRAWTHEELQPTFAAAGFGVRLHGDMQGGSFDPGVSHDLVIVGERGQ